MTNIVSVDETRRNLSEIISRAQYGKERFLVQKNKKNAVMILSLEDFEDNVMPELQELSEKEITPELRKLAKETKRMPRSQFVNM